MGTNYYAHFEPCPHCGRAKRVEHIGKSSGGWTFSFHATEEIRSWEDWQRVLQSPDVEIRFDGDQLISFADFEALVEKKRSSPHNHAREYPDERSWLDQYGNSFFHGEFC